MGTPILVQGDTRPTIKANLYVRDSSPREYVNLAGVQGVRFQMRKADDKRYTVNGSATVTSTVSGGVEYQLGASDLDTAGDYFIQWEVTFGDGKVQTTSVQNPITVRRQ
jgi:hypothetical protein